MKKLGIVGMVAGALLAGCAETPAPMAQVHSTSQSIGVAEGAQARNVPAASYHLALAKEQSAKAEQLLANGYTEQGKRLLLRAESDAQLAYALARQDSERVAAQKAIDRVRTLQGSAR